MNREERELGVSLLKVAQHGTLVNMLVHNFDISLKEKALIELGCSIALK